MATKHATISRVPRVPKEEEEKLYKSITGQESSYNNKLHRL